MRAALALVLLLLAAPAGAASVRSYYFSVETAGTGNEVMYEEDATHAGGDVSIATHDARVWQSNTTFSAPTRLGAGGESYRAMVLVRQGGSYQATLGIVAPDGSFASCNTQVVGPGTTSPVGLPDPLSPLTTHEDSILFDVRGPCDAEPGHSLGVRIAPIGTTIVVRTGGTTSLVWGDREGSRLVVG